MKPLAPPSQVATVLSFDFDGTLHAPDESPPVPAAFFDAIRDLRARHAVTWGINTGRSLEHAIEGFAESAFPFAPDWVVAREREIYYADASGRWQPDEPWNSACEEQLHSLFHHARPALDAVRRMIEEHTGAQWICMEGEPAGAVSRTNEEMDWIVRQMLPLVVSEPRLGWQRNTIYLRFGHRDFNKGTCLTEIARRHGLGAARCFTIGDSHNDLEMLDPAHAAMLACPANALDEVKSRVAAHGGCVATAAHGAGVLQALAVWFPPA